MPDRAPPWLRRSEQTRLSSASDDEEAGAKRDPRRASEASGAIKEGTRRAVLGAWGVPDDRA